MQLAYQYNNYLFTQAGVSRKWVWGFDLDIKTASVAYAMNELWLEHQDAFGFLDDTTRDSLPNPYGDNTWQSPLWIRPGSLNNVALGPFTHVVGHTHTPEINIDRYKSVIQVDCLDSKNQYLIIDDDEITVGEFIYT